MAGQPLLGPDLLGLGVVDLARALLGGVLHCRGVSGRIVETEAYHEREPSCHAHAGRTPRCEPLFAAPGRAYVYFTYGMHWCMNVVAEEEGVGAAVLIRALEPLDGIEQMRQRRSARLAAPRLQDLCSGPAKLCEALGIDGADNLADLTDPAGAIRVEPPAAPVPDDALACGPRIGISAATDLPWRFGIAASGFLSRPFPTFRHGVAES